MKNKKKLLIIMGACVTLIGTAPVSHAANLSMVDNAISMQSSTVQPRVNWTGVAYVSKAYWCNITSSNNLFPDSPLVTNHAGNPGEIEVRIINEDGKQVGETKTVKAGKSVRMDQIPAASGTYTLQAKATKTNGNYTITID